MDKQKVLEQLLEQLQRFLKILDGEKLSLNATVQKGHLTELLQSYKSSNGGDEEYIYMNKVIVTCQNQDKDYRPEANGEPGKHINVKYPPEPPPPRPCNMGREPFPLPPPPAPASLEPESYYEDPLPYDPISTNEDTEQVSSSYESYDEEEVTKGKSTAQHQWPSPEASIELMRDAKICAFLWRKKWLGQWAKQLCVIREHRLLCYKSSKDQTPLLDISLLGCSVVYKEKQTKRKEHKLKITPLGGEAIVLGLQSKEQAEQWLKVIQEICPKNTAGSADVTDSPTHICTKGEQSERYSVASESGSSTDSHTENLESKDVKKKYGKFSNLMNIGKKKVSSLESAEKNVDTSGYLNILVNTQWRSRWCSVKDRQLWIYNDKSKNKVAQHPLSLEGCMVLPEPSPEHLYSFRLQMDGEELATLEAKSSADMGHWLGLILSQTGTKTDPEDLTYDYVNSERISSIVNAARTSMYLMQRRYSEPNTYTDSPPSDPHTCDDIYDDVASMENEQEEDQEVQNGSEEGTANSQENEKDRVYLDLVPVRSFLHTSSGRVSPHTSNTAQTEPSPSSAPPDDHLHSKETETRETSLPSSTENLDPPPVAPRVDTDPSPAPNLPVQTHRISFLSQEGQKRASPTLLLSQTQTPQTPPTSRGRAASTDRFLDKLKFSPAAGPGSVEVKLGKNRTEADVRLYTDERDRLEREREEVKNTLATLRKDRREVKEELSSCQDPTQQASLEARLKQMEETCREAERRRVEVELSLMEVKENLRKVEAGPFTLGTTVDSSLLEASTPKIAPVSSPAPTTPISTTNNGDSPINSATALKNRPMSTKASSKGKVLQKAKVRVHLCMHSPNRELSFLITC
uniref:Actin filament-associated protein 1-like 2 n=1 Tax=Cyprinus carpio TaxID=7962 RepID=A0A8C1UUA0_CYPCA